MRALSHRYRFNASKKKGTIISIPLTQRNLGAMLGILAAVLTVSYIGFRLHEAATPVATSLAFSSHSAVAISLQSVRINDEEVLPKGWTPPVPQSSDAVAGSPQGVVALQVGRPVTVKASLSSPPRATADCVLEPRPYGNCVIRLHFKAPTDMQCEYACSSEAPKP